MRVRYFYLVIFQLKVVVVQKNCHLKIYTIEIPFSQTKNLNFNRNKFLLKNLTLPQLWKVFLNVH